MTCSPGGLRSRSDGLVQPEVVGNRLRPGLVFRIPGRSSLSSTARHRQRPHPTMRVIMLNVVIVFETPYGIHSTVGVTKASATVGVTAVFCFVRARRCV